MIIQVIGLPGTGKTTLASELSDRINAIHLNADYVRSTINSDLGFSLEDRIEHARRLGEMARMLSGQGHHVVVDFICPTKETRSAFGSPDKIIWMHRTPTRNFDDTTLMWEDPSKFDLTFDDSIELDLKIKIVIADFQLHDWREPTTLMLGRYQPWHEGHHALYEEANKRTKQVMLGVRDTYKTSEKDPLKFDEVKHYIDQDPYMDKAMVIKMPNITNIVYGRDVGYKIEQVKLGDEIESISATQKRREMGI
ncbi:MAG: adenylyl-sulfate kinase [Chitinophagia bacterium]|jgi:adenylylsulfate kinase-like enzyme|nr:adenylyl-sulfate kinase [Chitinophagia bacterium]